MPRGAPHTDRGFNMPDKRLAELAALRVQMGYAVIAAVRADLDKDDEVLERIAVAANSRSITAGELLTQLEEASELADASLLDPYVNQAERYHARLEFYCEFIMALTAANGITPTF